MDEILGMITDDTIAIKFEAILDHDTYRNTELRNYKRPRDAVQATLSSRNKEYAKRITLVPLRAITKSQVQYIPEDLFNICLKSKFDDYALIEDYIKSILNDGATIRFSEKTYSIDGVVVSVSLASKDLPSIIDPTHEVAIKILFNVKTGTLKTIDFQFGKQGRITPVAILDPPVMFDNVKVDHVTLSTLQRVVDMQLRHNDTVRVMYNIVPYLIDSMGDGDYPIPVPQKCPICGEPLDYLSYKLVRCSNPNCKGLRLGAIIRHAEKMKMFGLGKGVIQKLYDEEFVLRISDLYDLRKWDDCIAQMPGFGYTSYENMIKSVDTALANATLERFLGALPFNDTDEKTWKLVVNAVGREKLIKSMVDGTFPEMIMSVGYIPNVGTGKIQRMVDGYLRNKDELQELMEWVPMKLKEPLPVHITQKGRVCFTGFRDKNLEQELEENGWEVGGFSKDCKLIVPDLDYDSDKVRRAKELGLEIFTKDMVPEFLFQPF
jgi:NAD-dependent DNA ligase